MRITQIFLVSLLFAFTSFSHVVSMAQETTPPKQRTYDPFEAAENPFDEIPKNESIEQKHIRILNSREATIEDQRKTILRLQAEIETDKEKHRKLISLTFDSIKMLFASNETSKQIEGLRLLESVEQTLNEIRLDKSDRDQQVNTIHSDLMKFLNSDARELRSAAIGFLERNLCELGIRLGYQPMAEFWHPINYATSSS